jgi:hypothetical protein
MQSEIQLKLDSGTILDALNVRNIPKLRLALPPDGTAAKFERFVRPVRAMMELIYVRTGP